MRLLIVSALLLSACQPKFEPKRLIAFFKSGDEGALCGEIWTNPHVSEEQIRQWPVRMRKEIQAPLESCPAENTLVKCLARHDGKTFREEAQRQIGVMDFRLFYYKSPVFPDASAARSNCRGRLAGRGYEVTFE